MNSVGVMSSAGVGRLLADWIVDGAPPGDVWEVDIARADPAAAGTAHIQSCMEEAVSDLMAMHWPFKQPKAGRGLRKTALHDRWAGQGAVFGLTAGWERGLWYARDDAERDLPYCVADQPWWPIATREAAVMAQDAALLDLSPFGKFNIAGADALAFLNHIACAQMDVATGRAVYSPILNPRGGIEADVTITRLGRQEFRLTSGAATRWRDQALLRRAAKGWQVSISDVTESEAVIGVMGAGSRDILQGLAGGDWHAFPFATARDVMIAGVPCRATRLSFVGELGWELNIPAKRAVPVFDALIAAGARPMGHYALDGCRIEKGFRHWGHDLGPEITPLEAGLGVTVDWGKEFVGKPALELQRAQGLAQRIVLLEVQGGPLILHDEPVLENGALVGLTTSGGRGARTGKTLALALIALEPGETPDDTAMRGFEINVAGRLYPARVLSAPPFDPKGERMRA